MPYDPQTWANSEAGGTPLSADRLTHMETGIDNAALVADAAAPLASLGDAALLDVGTIAGTVAAGDDSRFGGGGPPTGAAGGVLGGTYPNPSFAVDMATQAELDAEAALARNGDNITGGTVADARIAATIARDSEVTAAVAAEATLARNGDNITSGTVADARIASTIARDSEVTAAVSAHEADTTNVHGIADTSALATVTQAKTEALIYALSDETTAITTGNAKLTIRMPFAMTLTAVRASLTTASSSGIPTVDINEGGSTILSTKLTIDASEKTSTTAATAAVISDSALADDAEITFDIDVAGTNAAGLKVTLIGVRA